MLFTILVSESLHLPGVHNGKMNEEQLDLFLWQIGITLIVIAFCQV